MHIILYCIVLYGGAGYGRGGGGQEEGGGGSPGDGGDSLSGGPARARPIFRLRFPMPASSETGIIGEALGLRGLHLSRMRSGLESKARRSWIPVPGAGRSAQPARGARRVGEGSQRCRPASLMSRRGRRRRRRSATAARSRCLARRAEPPPPLSYSVNLCCYSILQPNAEGKRKKISVLVTPLLPWSLSYLSGRLSSERPPPLHHREPLASIQLLREALLTAELLLLLARVCRPLRSPSCASSSMHA